MIPSPTLTTVEISVANSVEWVRLLVEATGAAIIAFGAISAIVLLFKTRRPASFNAVRLRMATYLVLALEFQVAADILSTSVAPTWEKIGKLAAIATIRTALSYFLTREIAMEKEVTGKEPIRNSG